MEVAFVVEEVDESGMIVEVEVEVGVGVNVDVDVGVGVDISITDVEGAAADEARVALDTAEAPVLKGTFCLCMRSNSAADAKESTASSAENMKAVDCDRSIFECWIETNTTPMFKTAEPMLDD